MGVYHETATPTVAFNPYLPAIGRVLEVLRRYGPGATIEISNRDLADAAGMQSAGHIPQLLRQLVKHKQIERVTTPRGSLIMVVGDWAIPHGDQLPYQNAIDPTWDHAGPQDASDPMWDQPNPTVLRDQSIIRTDERSHMTDRSIVVGSMVHDARSSSTTTTPDQNTNRGGAGGGERIADACDPDRDRFELAALVLAELGADSVTLATIRASQPDLTPSEILPQWQLALEEERTGGVKSARRLLFGQLMKPGGRVYASRMTSAAVPINPAAYADDPGFKLGSDAAPPSESEQREAAYRDAHWRAVDLLRPGAPFRDMAIVVERLVAGDSDEQALKALALERGTP